jgi:GT2 family glycosyltransferase
MIFVCLPLHNRIAYTVRCIDSLLRQLHSQVRIIVCDDGSTDGTTTVISEKYPMVRILHGNGNLWWTGGINRCVEAALEEAGEEDYIYTLNNDTEVLDLTLGILDLAAKKNPNAIFGSLNLFYEDPTRIETSAFVRSAFGLRRLHKWGQANDQVVPELVEVDGLTGKGVLIPVRVFKKIGLYNEKDLPHYHADLEFSIRAKRAGFTLFLVNSSALLSHQGQSGIGSVMSAPSVKEFLQSFRTLRSTHHYPSLRNYKKLVHGRWYFIFLWRDLLLIVLGFIKRFFIYHFTSK